MLAPDGEYVGIYSGDMPIAFYTNHINLTIFEGENGVRRTSTEQVLYLEELIDKYPEDNIRIIPYKTLSGEGALTAFKPEKVIIDGKEVIKGCYVAVCDGRLNGEIKSLIGNDVSEG